MAFGGYVSGGAMLLCRRETGSRPSPFPCHNTERSAPVRFVPLSGRQALVAPYSKSDFPYFPSVPLDPFLVTPSPRISPLLSSLPSVQISSHVSCNTHGGNPLVIDASLPTGRWPVAFQAAPSPETPQIHASSLTLPFVSFAAFCSTFLLSPPLSLLPPCLKSPLS